jgi:hypothetical protein
MKSILFSLTFCLLGFFHAFGQKEPVQKPLSNANIQFAEKQHDFGDVKQGETVSYKFKFSNSGTEPLVILNVQTTCGCTAPDWPKSPIPPGESSEIVVNFNTTKKVGRQNKIITVYTNGQKPEEKLKIVANILPQDQNQTPASQPSPGLEGK